MMKDGYRDGEVVRRRKKDGSDWRDCNALKKYKYFRKRCNVAG
jgi:hypothetical protein